MIYDNIDDIAIEKEGEINMNLYERKIQVEIADWKKSILKKPNPISNLTKSTQTKLQNMVPDRIMDVITKTIKNMTQSIIYGSSILSSNDYTKNLSLAEQDYLVIEKFSKYQKVGVIQGAGFGAGGIILGFADFPALIGIKIKFLYDCAATYGFDVEDKKERFFMLFVFQLAFSSYERRRVLLNQIDNWEDTVLDLEDIDWAKFQMEYRDYLDIAKLLQLLPVVGAVFGASANYKLLGELKECAMNCYRMRKLKEKSKL